MKKAQMEIFGLAVVVILVFIGMIMLLNVYMKTPTVYEQKEQYGDQTLAQNLLDMLFGLNTTCSLGFGDLIKDCYLYSGKPDQIYMCEGIDSCTYISGVLNNSLNRTFVQWNKPFMMNVYGDKGPVYQYATYQCDESVRSEMEIPLYPELSGTMTAAIDVCV
jgi:hypothetical protein